MSRTIVLTGASAGVGRATAREFGRRGARSALLARNEVALQATADEVRTALVLPMDVSDFEQVDAAAERAEAEPGPIDVWVNDAAAAGALAAGTAAALLRR
jgi:NAD(P)-dependent dehydrogenase (short-subunit alcohol dehydrogenase family)